MSCIMIHHLSANRPNTLVQDLDNSAGHSTAEIKARGQRVSPWGFERIPTSKWSEGFQTYLPQMASVCV